jgi:hypothetical protein
MERGIYAALAQNSLEAGKYQNVGLRTAKRRKRRTPSN